MTLAVTVLLTIVTRVFSNERLQCRLLFSPHLQAPGLSTTGSSCCSVGRLLWLARPPSCLTSRGSPGRSGLSPPWILSSLSRRQSTAASGRSTRTRTQVQPFWNHPKPKQICPSVSTQRLRLLVFPDDAQFEMDMWGRQQKWSTVMLLFVYSG